MRIWGKFLHVPCYHVDCVHEFTGLNHDFFKIHLKNKFLVEGWNLRSLHKSAHHLNIMFST